MKSRIIPYSVNPSFTLFIENKVDWRGFYSKFHIKMKNEIELEML